MAKVLEDPNFGALKHYIIESTGLAYYTNRDSDLASAMVRALDGIPWNSAAQYLGKIRELGSLAMDRLAEELTIGETFFFRHSEMFSALKEHVFPDIYERKKEEKYLKIWSAGCSIGAEPYSIAIQLKTELAHLFRGWRIEILGTDINGRFLKMARRAHYEDWALRGMSPETRTRFFDKRGKHWELQKRFTDGVVFQQHNLVKDAFPSLANQLFGFDLVICRNVMIYFDRKTIEHLANQFHQTLLPGGWLALGHAEAHREIFDAYQTVMTPGAILYHRRASGLDRQQPPAIWKPPVLPHMPVMLPEVVVKEARAKASTSESMRGVPEVVLPEALEIAALSFNEAELILPEWEGLCALADTGRFAEARASCERLLEFKKFEQPGLYFMHALLLEHAGDSVNAVKSLKKSLYLDRGLAIAHYHLGLILQKLTRKEEAKRSLRNAEDLIAPLSDDAAIRFGDGLTAGDLRSLIRHQKNRDSDQPTA